VIVRVFAVALGLIATPVLAVGQSLPSAVSSFESDIATHFVTADGFTLYVYDGDESPLKSACVAQCAVQWPPFTAADDAEPVGDWATFQRDDGTPQWAYRGRPVYKHIQDKHPRATVGDGVQGVWHIAAALKPRPPGLKFWGTIIGRVAVDPNGNTLYVRDDNTCTGACLKTWRPYLAPWAAGAKGDWSTVVRADDSARQWAWRGRPLYSYVNDNKPGDYKGDGVDNAKVLLLQPAAPLPSWVTVHPSDLGPVFANQQAMTLYTISDLVRVKAEATCNDECLAANWTPVLADATATPTGNWGLMESPQGPQWTYRSLPLFTHKMDRGPGSVIGDKFALGGGGTGWRAAVQATLIEEPL